MTFFHCTVCDHYHVDDIRLPCNNLGKQSHQAVRLADPKVVEEMRRKSQQMLNSPDVFLQTLKET